MFSDEDRRIFENTLLEVIGKTGWETFCWVLMSNHYHLVFRTPLRNLVEGMTWFQKTFTQRINARNRLRGHLFAGRYKAILVENEEFPRSSSQEVRRSLRGSESSFPKSPRQWPDEFGLAGVTQAIAPFQARKV